MARRRHDACTVEAVGDAGGVPRRRGGSTRRNPRLPAGAPTRFRWRARPYAVRGVLAFWLEAGPWWSRTWYDEQPPQRRRHQAPNDGGVAPTVGARTVEREVWRVEAAPQRDPSALGVYDLVHEPGTGRWWLAQVWD